MVQLLKLVGVDGCQLVLKVHKVFESEEDMIKSAENNEIKEGDVIVIRNQGPSRSISFMPEMLNPTSILS